MVARLLDCIYRTVQTGPPSNSDLSTDVSSSNLGLDMFRNFIQTVGGILPKLGYGHNQKYSLNQSQAAHANVHTAQDGDLYL